MGPVEQKKEDNICEFIVHMYQTEDLLRVYEFNLDSIEQYVISHLPITDEEKLAFKEWYAGIKEEMEKEGVQQTGHISRVQGFVFQLTELHDLLLKEDESYKQVYQNAELHINHHINLSEGKVINPIQICLNGVYGLLLLRLNGKKVEEDLMERLDQFGNVLSYLAVKFSSMAK